MDTGRVASHTGVCGGEEGRDSRGRELGGITWGEMPDIGDGGAANHTAMCVPQNLKCNKIRIKNIFLTAFYIIFMLLMTFLFL